MSTPPLERRASDSALLAVRLKDIQAQLALQDTLDVRFRYVETDILEEGWESIFEGSEEQKSLGRQLSEAIFYGDKEAIKVILSNPDLELTQEDYLIAFTAVCEISNASDLLILFQQKGILDSLEVTIKTELFTSCLQNDNAETFSSLLVFFPDIDRSLLYTEMVDLDARKILKQFIPSNEFAKVSDESVLDSVVRLSFSRITDTGIFQLLTTYRGEEIAKAESTRTNALDSAVSTNNLPLVGRLLKYEYSADSFFTVLRSAINSPDNLTFLPLLLDHSAMKEINKEELLDFTNSLQDGLGNAESVKKLIEKAKCFASTERKAQ